jgi:protein-disulfide isomerase
MTSEEIGMLKLMRSLAASAAILISLLASAPAPAQSSREQIEAVIKDYLAAHPEEIGQIVHDYMLKHPEALRSILVEIIKNGRAAGAGHAAAPGAAKPTTGVAIASNAATLFDSGHQVTIGNPQGDVTMVEFFDYNCGFCKRALSDTLALIKGDPNLKIVLKELPILGSGSLEAAQVAVAVRMQDPGGLKYLDFHQRLLGSRGASGKDNALTAAREVGLDMDRLERDMASDEVGATISESRKLAQSLGINGTPGYVIGESVIPGAIGAAGLKQRIDAARSQNRAKL